MWDMLSPELQKAHQGLHFLSSGAGSFFLETWPHLQSTGPKNYLRPRTWAKIMTFDWDECSQSSVLNFLYWYKLRSTLSDIYFDPLDALL